MNPRRLPGWTAIVVGVVVALALLAGIGVALGLVVLDGGTRTELTRAALLWVGPSAVLAFAAGGWAATRTAAGTPARGPGRGLLTGALALLAIVALVRALVGDALDFRSVGLALGIVEPPAGAERAMPPAVATAVANGAEVVGSPERSRERVIAAGGYAAAVALLLLGAAGLGGLFGEGERRGRRTIG